MLLEVSELVKRYRDLVAVDRVDFAIEGGTCFGLLGPNGAGKTTTIEMIEGIIAPSAGEIRYKGAPRGAAFREEIGIQFQQTGLLAFLTVFETLQTLQGLYRRRRDLAALVAQCGLGEIRDQMNDKISGGQRQRLLLALALVNDPELLFLDEPSTGLDPQARRNLWDIIGEIKAQGKTIILTTHYMEEAQALCDQVAIMDRGRIIARGTPLGLIRQHCEGITIVLPEDGFNGPVEAVADHFHRVNGNIEIQTTDTHGCLRRLMADGVDITGLTVRSPNLEDVFLNLTGRKLRA
jgi:ABC-2 type transport system ATP-binding protein